MSSKINSQQLITKASLRGVVAVAGFALAAAFQGQIASAQLLELACNATPAATLWTVRGPSGSEFVVEGSADLKRWTPVFADRFGTAPCQFIDPARAGWATRFYRGALRPPALGLADPAVMSASPFTVLTVDTSGLDLAADGIYARFFDEDGFTAEVPAIEVSASEVTFPVPACLDLRSKQEAGRTLNFQIIQKTAEKETISRVIRGFMIEELPHSDPPPGVVIVHFLEGAVIHAQSLLGQLPDTPFDTSEMREALTQYTAETMNLLEVFRDVMRTPSSPAIFGSVAGQALRIDEHVLENLDRLVLGLLKAQGADAPVPGAGLATMGPRFRIGSCARAEANAYGNALLHNPDTAGGARSKYYSAYGGCTAGAFRTGFQVIGGAGGVALSLAVLAGLPAEALALASGALLYITAQGAGGLIALSGALGQEDTAAAQTLQTGVEMMEDVLRGPFKATLDEMTGAILDLATSAASLKTAFATTELDSSPITGVSSPLIQLGRVGGCGGGTLTGSFEIIAPAGVSWTIECPDAQDDPTVEISSTSGMGSGTISVRIVAAPQTPTPGFSCEDISYFQFSPMLQVTFGDGGYATVRVQYEYAWVL